MPEYKLSHMRQIKERSIHYRGVVLHEMALLETNINEYLSIYFCGKERIQQREDINLLLFGDERITLMNKSQVFYFLATHYDKQWYNSYKSMRPKQPKKDEYSMNSDLVFVIEERNVFAHRLLDPLPGGTLKLKDNYPDTVCFLKFKNEASTLEYSPEIFDLLINSIKNIRNYIGSRWSEQS